MDIVSTMPTAQASMFGQKPSPVRRAQELVGLAVAYVLSAYIGLSLAVPPGYATIVWPASGVALCAMLLLGRRAWLGLWIGALCLNLLYNPGELTWPKDAPRVVGIAVAVSSGEILEVFVAWWVIQKFWPKLELSDVSEVLRFVTSVILLPCLVSPTIGVGALFIAELVPLSGVAMNWGTWAVGDILGVTFLLPILLFSRHSPIPVRWQGRELPVASASVAVSLAATMLITFYAWNYASEREYQEGQAALAALATDTEQALADRIAIYERALDAASGFAANSEEITPSEWREYVAGLDLPRAFPGMNGLGFFQAVPAERMPAFREQFEREHGARYRIHPEVDRAEHFIIDRIEPMETNWQALGLDLSFELGRRKAIARSREDGRTTMTRPIVLVQDLEQSVGFLLMKPVEWVTSGECDLWAYAPLVASDFLSGLTPREGKDYLVEVYFGTEVSRENLMFATSSDRTHNHRFEEVRQVEMANQPVTIRWLSRPTFEKRVSTAGPLLILISGIIITTLLGFLMTAFLRRESTVLRKVEEATADIESHNRMLKLAEATAHVGHWHFDILTRELYWSDEVYRIHGRKMGLPVTVEIGTQYYHPEDRDSIVALLREATTTKSGFRFTGRLVRDDGELRHIEAIGQVTVGSDGTALSHLGVLIDRTQETLMRESLTKARDEARAADFAKTTFLANMSHEIRTPMNGVIGFTELALNNEEDPVQRQRLRMVADSGNAMLSLLNDLLDFAKIEANQVVVAEEPTDLRETLQSVVRLMESVALSKGLDLSIEVDPALPEHVLIDELRLRQVLLNLVGNAIKFTEEGGVRVVAMVDPHDGGSKPRMVIEVHDTGIGIPAHRLASVFEKFIQADETTERRYGGTGLGLPISAQLAELMGGLIRVESRVGAGSVFYLQLPLREIADAAAAATPAAVETALPFDREAAETVAGAPLRILVAEDNPVNQELTLAMIAEAGHKGDLAVDGQEAVAKVVDAGDAGAPYDLVLMDMQMPVLDGIGAAEAIREAGFTPGDLPIIAVTANAYAEDIERCRAAGMQAHIAKPLRTDKLVSLLQTFAGREAGTDLSLFSEPTAKRDPRIDRLFEERVERARATIDLVLAGEALADEDRSELASILHQIAGVAGYFGQAELGDKCREAERLLLEGADLGFLREFLREICADLDAALQDTDPQD